MRKKDCKEGLEVIFNKSLKDEDIGVIVKINSSIFTKNNRHVWVKWKDENVLYVESGAIEPLDKVRKYLNDKFEKPDLKKQALAKLTTEEIEALGLKT